MGSGARRSGRIRRRRHRGRSSEMKTMAAARGPSGHVRRRGGRGRHCGARERVGEERGWWWPRRTASVAMGAGARGSQEREGKREPEEGERSRGRGENAGRLWVSPWRRRDAGEAATAKQEVEARARARRHASASRQRLKTAVPLVGWAAKWTC